MKKVIDYTSREIIFYKFICNDPTIISTYVGHTINFTDRKGKHKRTCYNEKSKKYNFLLYKTIRENGGWDNWTIFEIERKIVSSKQEALQNEQRLIDLQVEKLNMCNAVLNIDLYNKNITTYKKIYYAKNRNQILENKKEYHIQNKEQISLQKKIYRDLNKEEINLKRRQRRELNKEGINLQKREKYAQKKELNLMSKEDKV